MSEIVAALLFFAGGLILIVMVIPGQVATAAGMMPNPRTFPYVISCIFSFLCFCWAVNVCRHWWRSRSVGNDGLLGLGLLIGGGIIGLVILIEQWGYLLGGAVAVLIVFLAIEGLRKWPHNLVAAVLMVVLFSLFFERVLHIEVPVGMFGLSLM